MRTIEERAKVVGTLSQFRSDYPYDKRSIMVGYIKGATDQKDIDIEKACEWIKENVECGVHPSNAYGFADRFRKAMEEQL